MKIYNLDEQLSEIFNQYGAFYAFSDRQLDELKKEGVKYVNAGAGLICPKENTKLLFDAIEKITNGKIAWELANNTKKNIIWYQLANHECQISYDFENVAKLLKEYGITRTEIATEWKPYLDHCVKEDSTNA